MGGAIYVIDGYLSFNPQTSVVFISNIASLFGNNIATLPNKLVLVDINNKLDSYVTPSFAMTV